MPVMHGFFKAPRQSIVAGDAINLANMRNSARL